METTKSDVLIFSRISFCQNCYDKSSPKHGELCVIWHTNHKQFAIHNVKQGKLTRGFTSHIYMTKIPIPPSELVMTSKTCGICDCSIETDEGDEGEVKYFFEVKNSTEVTLPKNEWLALWKKFKDVGYEIE